MTMVNSGLKGLNKHIVFVWMSLFPLTVIGVAMLLTFYDEYLIRLA